MEIKICFIIDSLKIGGATILTANVIRYLSNAGFIIKLIVLTEKKLNSENIIKLLPNNIEIINIDILKYKFINRIKILKNEISDYDVIHTCLENSNFYGSLLNLIFLKKKKFISTIHGIDGVFIEDESLKLEFKKKSNVKYYFITKYVTTILLKFYEVFIAVSKNTKEFLINKRKINSNKICVIYHGIDIDYYNTKLKLINDNERKKLPVNKSDFIIYYVGRITYAKGLEYLIEIFNDLQKENDNIKLVFVGDGELRNDIESKIKYYAIDDKCIITGFIDNVDYYYKNCHLFVLPSKSEGIPLTLLEAMYYKSICLCSDVGGMPEVIKDSYNGYLFKLNDFENFKKKIKLIINNYNELDNIKENAHKTIINNFNFANNIIHIKDTIFKISKDEKHKK